MMKKKLLKKLLCLTISSIMAMGCLVGCGDKKQASKGDGKEIEIRLWNAGNGTEYVEKVIEAFEEEHSEYTVKLVASVEQSSAAFGLPDADTTDLYISVYNMDYKYLEPLDDILDYTVPGESRTIREKLGESYLDTELFEDGHYYNLTPGSGGGGTGFVYNTELFEKAGITQLPRTSDELALVCDTLLESDITPMASFKNGGYWSYIGEAWFLQYDGWDYYYNTFYQNKGEDGTSPSKEAFKKKDGRYQTLKALEKIVTPEYMLAGSTSQDHITIQTQFINGAAAIMLNGSWLENEMASVGKVDTMKMMKMPVISSIVDKLDTVKTETDLRQLISAIDVVADGSKKIEEFKQGETYVVNGKEVSAHDWDYVNLARHTAGVGAGSNALYIPNYSDAIEGAKEFMKFWYSDKAIAITCEVLDGRSSLLPQDYELDTSDWSPFEKNVSEVGALILQSGSQFMKSQHEIFHNGGAISYGTQIGTYLQYFSAGNPLDRIDADEAWRRLEEFVDLNYDNNWLANIK